MSKDDLVQNVLFRTYICWALFFPIVLPYPAILRFPFSDSRYQNRKWSGKRSESAKISSQTSFLHIFLWQFDFSFTKRFVFWIWAVPEWSPAVSSDNIWQIKLVKSLNCLSWFHAWFTPPSSHWLRVIERKTTRSSWETPKHTPLSPPTNST